MLRLLPWAACLILALALLQPTPAFADDECGAQSGTNPIECPTGTYNNGITYSSIANLTLNTEGGAVNTAVTGIDLTGNDVAGPFGTQSHSVTLDTTAGAVSGSGGINITSGAGAVTVTSGSVAGGIDIQSLSGVVTAVSTAGDIDIHRAREATDDSNGGSVSGNITATGAGNITLFRAGGGSVTTESSAGSGLTHITNSNTSRVASITSLVDATVGSGGLILDITGVGPDDAAGGFGTFGESAVNGVTLQGAGAAEINLWRDEFLINTSFRMNNNYARLQGAVDASGLAGGLDLNVMRGGAWALAGSATLSPGDDSVHIGSGGFAYTTIFTPGSFGVQSPAIHVVDFGDGQNQFINEGRILVGVEQITVNSDLALGDFAGTPRDRYQAELHLLNLDRFEQHGEIWLGTSFQTWSLPGGPKALISNDPDQVFNAQGTDRATDDMLALPGTTFVGGPAGRVFMDIDLNNLGGDQDRCDASMRDADGQFPAADCINLQNGAIEGVILLDLTNTSISGDRGNYNPNANVLVDLSDGNGGPGSGAGAAPGQVVVAPDARFHNPAFGGVRDDGMFMSVIFYDEETTQFKVQTVPSGGAQHQPLIGNAAQAAWRTANSGFFDRQADLRDTLRGGSSDYGVWIRTAHDAGERDIRQTHTTPANVLEYDSTHDVDTTAVTLGVDMLAGGWGDGSWVVGGMVGYVRTDMEYARFYTDTVAMNGMLAGAYGSYVSGPLFVDAAVSGIWTKMDQDMPQAELFDDRTLSSDVRSIGARIEGGWRFDLGRARLEPLANASWVRTSLDDFKVPDTDPVAPGNQVMFDDTTSQRIGLGLRGSREFTLQNDVVLGLSLTGRVQEELDGEATAKIGNLNPISPEVKDEFDGTFGELIGGVTLANSTGRVSGVLNVGGKFGDDYDALSASASFRYQW